MEILPGYARFETTVRDGKIVIPEGVHLPEETEVMIVVKPMEFTPEERAEFEAWDRLSDEAFQMILDLEQEERDARG